MTRKLITERDVVEAAKTGTSVLQVDATTIITPSARDAALQLRIQIVSGPVAPGSGSNNVREISIITPKAGNSPNSSNLIALGSDHGGYRLKEMLKEYLGTLGYSVADVGTTSEEACDYPDFAYAVAKLVASGQAMRGIMIDGVGVASAIVANKVPGIRAVPCYDEFVARSSREHNDANVLTLGGRILGTELAKAIVKTWLETWFGGGRHQSRVQKIADIEKRYSAEK